MAEIIVAMGSLLMAGNFFNKEGKQPRSSNFVRKKIPADEKPSSNDTYTSDRFLRVKDMETKELNKRWELSKDPHNTGIIPPLFNTLGVNECCDFGSPLDNTAEDGTVLSNAFRDQQTAQLSVQQQSKILNGPMFSEMPITQAPPDFSVISTQGTEQNFNKPGGWGNVLQGESSLLTGLPLDTSHNNQTPFFGSTVTQNLNGNQQTLEQFTGTDPTWRHKRELEQNNLFAPVIQDIFGTPNTPEELRRERYHQSNLKTNVLPFPQVRVASGLNQVGYGTEGSGGFHDDYRPHVRNVDELRVKNNPKQVYEGRVLSGQNPSTVRRGQIGQVSKNQPDRFYINTPDRYGGATAAVHEVEGRPDIIMRDTNDSHIIADLHGHAGTDVNRPTPGMQKADYLGKPVEGFVGDPNNTDLRTIHRATWKTSFKKPWERNVAAPGRDVNDYGAGNFNILEEERQTTEPLTSAKQLNVHGEIGEGQMPLFDIAKQTLIETLPQADYSGRIKAHQSDGTGYQIANVVMDPTNKQFTSLRGYTGIADREEFGTGYLTNDHSMKTTLRQTVNIIDYQGGAGQAVGEPTSYAAAFASQQDRQWVNNPDYMGISGATQQSQELVNRVQYNNARVPDGKEILISGERAPGPERSNATIGARDITMNFQNNRTSTIPNQAFYINHGAGGTVVQPPPPAVITQFPTTFRSNPPVFDDRLNPELLQAFRNNPYTQKLNVY